MEKYLLVNSQALLVIEAFNQDNLFIQLLPVRDTQNNNLLPACLLLDCDQGQTYYSLRDLLLTLEVVEREDSEIVY